MSIRAENVVLDLTPLQNLKKGLQRKIIKKAIATVSKVIQKDAKGVVPKLTGAYRMSIGIKTTQRKKGLSATGIIGAKAAYVKTIKKSGKVVRPVRYAHILEYGSRYVAPRRGLSRLWKGKHKQYLKIANDTIKSEVKKELSKGKK